MMCRVYIALPRTKQMLGDDQSLLLKGAVFPKYFCSTLGLWTLNRTLKRAMSAGTLSPLAEGYSWKQLQQKMRHLDEENDKNKQAHEKAMTGWKNWI